MGRDKARLPFRGATLAQSVARAVAAAAGSAVLVGSPESCGGLGFPGLPDLYPGEGPLGGILSALQNTRADWNLVVACDMPELSAGFLRRLLEAAGATGADVLLPAGPSGRPEPLCAVYHRRCRQALGAAFASGIRQVTAAFGDLRVVPFPVAEVTHFQNVNTPEEWAAYGAE